MTRIGLFSLLLALLLGGGPALAWDDNWTQARSGDTLLYDKDSKHGNAGTDERPQTFFIPPPRDFWDVDPEELGDYGKKQYTPYALARVTQNISYNGFVLTPGYYLIKPGDYNDGSPRTNLGTQPSTAYLQPPPAASSPGPAQDAGAASPALPPMAEPPPSQPGMRLDPAPAGEAGMQPISDTSPSLPPLQAPAPAPGPDDAKAQEESAYKVFVLKKLGRVIAVIPIHRMEHYNPPRKEKAPRHAVAWVAVENNHPVLKFYYKKRIYSTDFQ